MKMIAGAKSLLLGLASAITANILGRLIDKEHKKYSTRKKDAEISIPTLKFEKISNALDVKI
jgi:hypothetical protein